MKPTHSHRNSKEIRPIWYLALLVYPAITTLFFILAGSGNGQPSNLAKGQQAVSGTTPAVASYAIVSETPAP